MNIKDPYSNPAVNPDDFDEDEDDLDDIDEGTEPIRNNMVHNKYPSNSKNRD